MEIFSANKLDALAFHAINQKGQGTDIDRYIYQEGQGLGSFFGNLLRKSVPLLGKAIKGAAHIAKPHAKAVAKELANSAIKQTNKEIEKAIHRSHKRPRQTG
tara:strand:- start:233 stop:538 length:306 start_codon:yes stop_codon:yes gene_type:complete